MLLKFRPIALFPETHSARPLRFRVWAVALGLMAGLSAPAQALMIGAPQTRAELGRTLQMSIPIRLDAQESLPLSCVQAQAQSGDDGPGLGRLSIASAPAAGGVTLSLRSQQPLREPILIVRLHLACQYQRTQIYTLLVDPPAPELPMVAGSAVAPVAASPSSRSSTQGTPAVPALAAVTSQAESAAAAPQVPRQARPVATLPVRRLPEHERPRPSMAKPVIRAEQPRREPLKAPPAPPHASNRLELDDLSPAEIGNLPELRLATALPAVLPQLSAQQRSELNQLRQLILDATAAPGEPQPTLQQINALQERATVLQRQFEQASAQLQRSQSELAQTRAQSYSAGVVYALLAALVALGLLSFWLWRRGADPGLSESPFVPASVAKRSAAPESARAAPLFATPATSMSVQTSTIQPPVMPFGLPPMVDGRPLQPEIDALQPDMARQNQWGDSGIDWDSRFMQPLNPDKQVHVDELMDAGHLAEYFIDTGDEERAVSLLEESLDDSTSESFALPYLMLFDLYRKLGRQQAFETLFGRFQRRFNVAVPPWGASAEVLQQSQGRELTDYDRAMKLITLTWGDPQIVTVLERMLLDDPHQHRMGFELAAYRDLLMLYAVARDLFPDTTATATQVEHVELSTLDVPAHLDLDFELPLEPPATEPAQPKPEDETAKPATSEFKLQPRANDDSKDA